MKQSKSQKDQPKDEIIIEGGYRR